MNATPTHWLDFLRQGKQIDLLYRECYPALEQYVLSNSGTRDEAADLFQETVLVLLQKISDPGFRLTCSLNTYVFAIGKNRWLKELRRKRRLAGIDTAPDLPEPTEEPPASRDLFRILGKLTAHCLRLLSALFLEQRTLTEVAQTQGYANSHTARNQKYKCLVQARKATQG